MKFSINRTLADDFRRSMSLNADSAARYLSYGFQCACATEFMQKLITSQDVVIAKAFREFMQEHWGVYRDVKFTDTEFELFTYTGTDVIDGIKFMVIDQYTVHIYSLMTLFGAKKYTLVREIQLL